MMYNIPYQGESEKAIDEKGRVVVPKKFTEAYFNRMGEPLQVLYGTITRERIAGLEVPLLQLWENDRRKSVQELRVSRGAGCLKITLPPITREILGLDARAVFIGDDTHIDLINKLYWDICTKKERAA